MFESSTKTLPRIGITMGDAAGIGPEVVVKALAGDGIFELCRPMVVGDLKFLKKASDELGLGLKFHQYTNAGKDTEVGAINVIDLANLDETVRYGIESKVAGKASAEYIEKAVEMWKSGAIDAISTAPISKRSLALGGYDFPGHTEFLASLTGTKEFAMSFFAENLRVVLLSTHVSLQRAIELVKKDSLVKLIVFTHKHLSRLIGRDARIAVAGLNPHASEGGMFGNEEAAEMVPAVNECRDKHGIDVSGPYSPDTIFIRGFRGEFDAVVACYHDQATIPVKALSFGSAVNVTLGLPLIRTSVDHGTAYDIAGKNMADAESMKAAIRLAAELASHKTLSANAD